MPENSYDIYGVFAEDGMLATELTGLVPRPPVDLPEAEAYAALAGIFEPPKRENREKNGQSYNI